jgi:hypothetical protein
MKSRKQGYNSSTLSREQEVMIVAGGKDSRQGR